MVLTGLVWDEGPWCFGLSPLAVAWAVSCMFPLSVREQMFIGLQRVPCLEVKTLTANLDVLDE